MCVRYASKGMAGRNELTREIFPGDDGVFVVEGGELVEGRWGLQPHWAKDDKFGRRNAYNARSETLSEKPTFRTAFRQRRCVLPAEAFYERAEGRWLRVTPAQGELFLFAGLWEEPNDATAGLPSYTMVTTEPNAAIADVHDRMPVVLSVEDAEDWMSPKAMLNELRALLVPCPPSWVSVEDAGPVSRKKPKDEELALF